MIHNVGYSSSTYPTFYIMAVMKRAKNSAQQDRAQSLLKRPGIARLSELTEAGITAATVSRMKERSLVIQLSRGLYQLPDVPTDANHCLAEAAKLVPKGVICLVSALAFHQLTGTIPPRIWMAIAPKDRRPNISSPRLQIVRFREEMLRQAQRTIASRVCRFRSPIPQKPWLICFAIGSELASDTRKALV